MKYNVVIDNFEGPLDLLLYLVKESNINIYDINISEITNQYLEYIKTMKDLNLTVASTYLVMASELIEMKSKYLLPQKETDKTDEYVDEREDLINRLVEYQKYKDVTEKLKELKEIRNEIHTKLPSSVNEYVDEKIIIESYMEVDELVDAFKNFLQRKKLDKPLSTKVTTKELSVSKRIQEIKFMLKDRRQISFDDLFETYSKPHIVVTFLGILELVKTNQIEISQTENFDNIVIEARGE